MALLGLDSLRGCVLDRNLYAPNGRFILAEGTMVTDRHVEILRSWGVVEGSVYGQDLSLPGESELLPGKVDPSMALWRDGWGFRWLCRAMAEAGRDPISPPEAEAEVPEVLPLDQLVFLEPGLVSYAPILQEIIEVLNSPFSSAAHVADVVVRDSALSARLLKLVNSPLYGFPRSIKSIEQAVAIVGSDDLMSLAVQVSSISYFSGISHGVMDMGMFWNNSISCALFARLLAFRRFRGDDSLFFVGGMLMNLGRLVMVRRMPGAFAAALRRASEGISLIEAETSVFGYGSPQVTQGLFDRWFLPPDLSRIVTEGRLNPSCRDPEALLFSVAEGLAAALGRGFAGDYYVPPVSDDVLELLGVSENELDFVWGQFRRQRAEIVDAFLGGSF